MRAQIWVSSDARDSSFRGSKVVEGCLGWFSRAKVEVNFCVQGLGDMFPLACLDDVGYFSWQSLGFRAWEMRLRKGLQTEPDQGLKESPRAYAG